MGAETWRATNGLEMSRPATNVSIAHLVTLGATGRSRSTWKGSGELFVGSDAGVERGSPEDVERFSPWTDLDLVLAGHYLGDLAQVVEIVSHPCREELTKSYLA